jgi:hypothetical protein
MMIKSLNDRHDFFPAVACRVVPTLAAALAFASTCFIISITLLKPTMIRKRIVCETRMPAV